MKIFNKNRVRDPYKYSIYYIKLQQEREGKDNKPIITKYNKSVR